MPKGAAEIEGGACGVGEKDGTSLIESTTEVKVQFRSVYRIPFSRPTVKDGGWLSGQALVILWGGERGSELKKTKRNFNE